MSPVKPGFFSMCFGFSTCFCLLDLLLPFHSSFSPVGGNPSGGVSRPVRHACVMILIVRRTKFFSCAFVFSKGITVWRYGLDYDGISYSHGFLVLGSRRWREQQTGFARIIPDTRPSGSLRSRPVDSWRSRRFFPPAGENDGLGRQCESQSVTDI